MERAELDFQTDFRKTADRTYLILCGAHAEIESYASHMLSVANIPGLLGSTREYIDGTVRECVDVTGKMPLTALEGRMTEQRFAEILSGLLKLAEGLERFLLSPDNLLIQPEFLYLTPGKGEICACFTAFSRTPVREQLYGLSEYLIRQMREEDREGMILACRIRRALQQDLPREKLLAELRGGTAAREACVPEASVAAEAVAREKPTRGAEFHDLPHRLREKDRAGRQKRTLRHNRIRRTPDLARACRMVLAGILFFGAVYLIWYRRQLNLGWRSWAVSAALFAAGAYLSVRALSSCVQRGKHTIHPPVRCPNRSRHPDIDAAETGYGADPRERYPSVNRIRTLPEQKPDPNDSRISSDEEGMTQLLNVLSGGNSKEAALVPLRPDSAGSRILLGHGTILIGKSADLADVVIREPAISRIHAKIVWRSHHWYLRDLGSRNGTFADGRPLVGNEEILLADGMIVTFSQLEYRVCIPVQQEAGSGF